MVYNFPSRNYIFARFGARRYFWKLRSFFQKHHFKRLRMGFRFDNRFKSLGAEAQYWRAVVRGTVKPMVFVLIISYLLYIFDRNIPSLINISWISSSFLGRYLMQPLDDGGYVQMLAVIASISGVFLALYFSAVSTVISNAYSSVPGDVRWLLLREKVGNKYVQLISFLTALSVILLAFSAWKMPPLHLAVPFLVALSFVAVFSFVQLGLRAFVLTDPTLFFGTIARELLRWVHCATYRGYQWHDRNFQTDYHNNALKSATTLVALVKITSGKPELRGESYPNLLNQLLILISLYLDSKHSIPTESEWYGKKSQHKQWYMADGITIETATRTDTALPTAYIPDNNWLEDLILQAVLKAMTEDTDTDSNKSLYVKVVKLPDFFNNLSRHWESEEAQKWYTRLSEPILTKLINEKHITREDELYSVAISDAIACLPMSIELGFIRALQELDVDNLHSRLLTTDWTKSDAPYHFALPTTTMTVLEKAQRGISFEQDARSTNMTPSWYVAELTFNNLELNLYDKWQSIMTMIESWYAYNGKALAKAEKYRQSLSVYSRAIELSWKLNRHLEQLRIVCNALHKDSKLDFIKKAGWNWQSERDRLDNFRKMAINGQADLIIKLWNDDKPDPDFPDFFGSAVHRTGEECYEALINRDAEEFAALFRPYFLGILGIFDSVRKQAQGEEPSASIARMSDPILDLFDISGYAYIYSEYYQQPELWEKCKVVWDKFIESSKQQYLDVFSVVSNSHQAPSFMIPARAGLRFNRQAKLEHLLNKLKRKPSNHIIGYSQVEHQSELIRSIAPISRDMPYMYVDAVDVFTVKYLMTVPSERHVDFGIRDDKIKIINKKSGERDA